MRLTTGSLGTLYQDGEVIVREGEVGDCMYVIQFGAVEVTQGNGEEMHTLARLEAGEFFGEMAIFERTVRSATVRAVGPTRILLVDKKTLLRRIQQDPVLAMSLLEKLSRRIRNLNEEYARYRAEAP